MQITADNLIVGRNGKICHLTIRQCFGQPAVLGNNFMSLAYVVADLANDEISMAKENFNTGEDRILEMILRSRHTSSLIWLTARYPCQKMNFNAGEDCISEIISWAWHTSPSTWLITRYPWPKRTLTPAKTVSWKLEIASILFLRHFRSLSLRGAVSPSQLRSMSHGRPDPFLFAGLSLHFPVNFLQYHSQRCGPSSDRETWQSGPWDSGRRASFWVIVYNAQDTQYSAFSR